MTTRLATSGLRWIERRMRLVAILDALRYVGLSPANVITVHAMAYLADALAPVWDLPILNGQVLKRPQRPFFPILQADLDRLVGQGTVSVSNVAYVQEPGGQWRIDADYAVNPEVLSRIFATVMPFEEQSTKWTFVREVVFAAAGLGPEGLQHVGLLDAAYSNPVIDTGEVIDIAPDGGGENVTAQVAHRFSRLVSQTMTLSSAELVHLYARHLYSRMQVV